jgi:hypothetical protein
MERMVPDEFPESVTARSERRCYEALRDRLDGSYTVLYGVPWVGRDEHEGQQGECDFMVLHPDRGALVIEVKGGTVRRDAGGRWTSSGADGDHAIDDPYAQANRSKWALRDYVRRAGHTSAAAACWGHAVWFSDARAPGDCGPDAPPEITLDYTAAEDPQSRIERRMGTGEADTHRGSGRMACVASWRRAEGR